MCKIHFGLLGQSVNMLAVTKKWLLIKLNQHRNRQNVTCDMNSYDYNN